MKYLIVLVILLNGCMGNNRSTWLTAQNKQDIAQQHSNKKEAEKTLVELSSNKVVAKSILDSMNKIDDNCDKIFGIDSHPKPLVTVEEWLKDPAHAKEVIDTSSKTLGDNAWDTMATVAKLAASAMIGVKILSKIAPMVYPPAAPFIAMADHLLAFGQHPTAVSSQQALNNGIEDYKAADPNWRENKVFAHISSNMTLKEKEFVKKKNRVKPNGKV